MNIPSRLLLILCGIILLAPLTHAQDFGKKDLGCYDGRGNKVDCQTGVIIEYSREPRESIGTVCPDGEVPAGPKRCMPAGSTNCGDGKFCGPGLVCGPLNKCLKPGETYCRGVFCAADRKCSESGKCIKKEMVDCRSFLCPEGYKCGSLKNVCVAQNEFECRAGNKCQLGQKCGSNRTCIPDDSTDCEDGSYCRARHACTPKGGCLSADKVPLVGYESRAQDLRELVSNLRSANAVLSTDSLSGERPIRRYAQLLKDAHEVFDKTWGIPSEPLTRDILDIIIGEWVSPRGGESWVTLKERIDTDLKKLMEEAIDGIFEVMKSDVNRLLAFEWNTSPEEKEIRKVIVERTLLELQGWKQNLALYVERDLGFKLSKKRTNIIYQGFSYRQLNDIAADPSWDQECRARGCVTFDAR